MTERRGLSLGRICCPACETPVHAWKQDVPEGVTPRFFLLCETCPYCVRIVATKVEVGEYQHGRVAPRDACRKPPLWPWFVAGVCAAATVVMLVLIFVTAGCALLALPLLPVMEPWAVTATASPR